MRVLAALCVLASLWVVQATAPVVTTPLGRVQGTVQASVLGRQYYSFLGLRYAKPPTGERRFKPPEPIDPWDGIYNASADGMACPQSDEDFGPMSEDCLFLNVHSPMLPTNQTSPALPVLVFIHQGAFYIWAGTTGYFGANYLMDQDIILVTLNYRLGALGFLSTGDDVLPGNNGLKDQVEALRWIQRNIQAFGGDPAKVTLGGYSAGSMSTLLHMVSPMSRGLFHQIIAMSGAIENIVTSNPFEQAQKQAELLGCPRNTSQQIVDCLKTKDSQEIADSLIGFVEWGWDPMLVFGCVIEPEVEGIERFLTENPTNSFIEGKYSQVPVMIGTTKNEFEWKELQVFGNDSWCKDLDLNFNKVAPISYFYKYPTNNSDYISGELRKFYLGTGQFTNTSRKGVGELYADSIIIFPVDRITKLISRTNIAPVYYYQFVYEGKYSYVYKPGTEEPYGVNHHDEQIYLFYAPKIFPMLNQSEPDFDMMKTMTKMWSSFVQTGNPTSNLTGEIEQWKNLDIANPSYFEIGKTQKNINGLYYQDRMLLWDRLFPLPRLNNKHKLKLPPI